MASLEERFDYQLREIIKRFISQNDMELEDNNFDINETIWKNKEEFGEIVYNRIVEYFGEIYLQDIADRTVQGRE